MFSDVFSFSLRYVTLCSLRYVYRGAGAAAPAGAHRHRRPGADEPRNPRPERRCGASSLLFSPFLEGDLDRIYFQR